MRPRRLAFAAALGCFALAGSPSTGQTLPPRPEARGLPRVDAARAPRVALVATAPGALHSSLYVVGPGDASPAPLATFTHAAGATARAALVPGTTTVFAIADTAETRDASFDASLFRLAPHAPPERLCDGVVHASRPVVRADGRVFVSRGQAGPEPVAAPRASMRVDALTVDEVDPVTGAVRTVHATNGYLAHLAGAHGAEILVYRIRPTGADVVAIDPDTRATRVILPALPPFARDFSVDDATGTLVFQGRHESDPHVWTIESVDLASGRRTRLRESASMSLVPHALRGGRVAWSRDGRDGLTILGAPGRGGPLGAGADWVVASSDDGRWIGALHTVQGAIGVPFVLDLASGDAFVLPAPPGARVAIAGFVPTEGGAL